jgi:hypothetical protein
MKSAKDALIQESLTLPLEVRDRLIKNCLISFQFEDGSMHHVIPAEKVTKELAYDCLHVVTGRKQRRHFENWSFLNEEDMKI